ncbi:MAG: hypothetical protein R2932_28045 [Caldilineaceae bacterium]
MPMNRAEGELASPFYVAYHIDMVKPTETFHNDIRGRFLEIVVIDR